MAHKVLVVEDDPEQRSRLVRALTNKGYDVKDAGGYHAASDLLDSEVFDVVVSDNSMESSNAGVDLRERMSLMGQGDIPFVLYTSDEYPGLSEKLKPFGRCWVRCKRRMAPDDIALIIGGILE